ncbi:MAG: hypothetical protein MI892_03360, partial [Desulfobacterales bacterium]|nr:hypothetical protein [Desulfobacterales bacterium]
MSKNTYGSKTRFSSTNKSILIFIIMTTIYDDPSVKLEFDPVKKQLVQRWQGFAVSEKFREAIDKTVSFVSTNAVNSIISDTLQQKVVKPDDSQYAQSAMPKLFKNGVKKMAF